MNLGVNSSTHRLKLNDKTEKVTEASLTHNGIFFKLFDASLLQSFLCTILQPLHLGDFRTILQIASEASYIYILRKSEF